MENGFAARVFFPKGSGSKPSPLPNEVRARLAITLKKELLKPQYNPVQILLESPNLKSLAVSVVKVRETAAIATWLRNPVVQNGKIITGELHAISLLLTGIEKEADDEAIRHVENFQDQVGNKLASVGSFVKAAVTEVRPILLTLCQSFEISIDALFIASMEMLAQAFFGQFGVEGDKTQFDNKPPE